jgi:3'-phosphoadenosine 5'-phosphosulfate sulfotransferase (PAPS reductase)/FAD synthetase
LLHLVRELYPEAKAMYVDTGLEYPEIKQFVKSFNNVDILRPKKMFNQVLEDYGFPVISKEVSECVDQARKAIACDGKHYSYRLKQINGERLGKDGKPSPYNYKKWKFLLDAPFKISNQCCNIMKKGPAHKYYKETGRAPIIGTMTEESKLRESQYLKQGCNGFNNRIPTSTPMAFWTEQDVLKYLKEFNIPYCSVYGNIEVDENGKYYMSGCQRTGCMFCGYGCHLEEEPNRFQKLKITHPKQYDYIINKLGMGEVLDYIGVPY